MRKIAIVGFKGGIGKTTISVNLGAGLALSGKRVLVIDTDTQANVSICLGKTEYKHTLANIILEQITAREAILETGRANLQLIPSSWDLFKATQRMVTELGREDIFNRIFADLTTYDYQILDCAPSLSLLTINAMTYADEIFIPVSMEILAMAGAQQFMKYLRIISRKIGPGAVIRLFIPTMYDPRRNLSKQILTKLHHDFGKRVVDPIRIDTKLSEAPGAGATIYEYAPDSRGAEDFKRLTQFVAAMPPVS